MDHFPIKNGISSNIGVPRKEPRLKKILKTHVIIENISAARNADLRYLPDRRSKLAGQKKL